MRVWVAIDSTREGTSRATWQEVADELEAEIDELAFDVNNEVVTLRVVGVGRTAADCMDSVRARRS
jgi:hypothetical protein